MLIPQADEVEPEAGTCFGSIGTPLGRSSSAASCSPPSSPIPTPSSPRSGRQSRRSEPARLRPDLRGYEPFAGSDGCSVAGVEDGFRAALLARFLTAGAGNAAWRAA